MSDELAQAIAKAGDNDEIQALLRAVCDLTGMGFAALAYVSETRWIACQVEDRVAFGLKPGDELEIKKTICDEIRESGRCVLIDDSSTDPDWRNHAVPVLYGFHSYVSLPLVVAGKFFGTLCALDDAPRENSLRQIADQLEAMAGQMATLLEQRTPLIESGQQPRGGGLTGSSRCAEVGSSTDVRFRPRTDTSPELADR